MNSNFIRNCRNHPLPLFSVGAFLFVLIFLATESSAIASRGWMGLAVVGMLGIAGGIYFLGGLTGMAFDASDARLVVHRPGGAINILYQNISRIDRVKRVSGGAKGMVRVTFRRAGESRTVDLHPDCPEALVWDILQRCPHLTRYKNLKLVRDRSFSAAGERLHDELEAAIPLTAGGADVF